MTQTAQEFKIGDPVSYGADGVCTITEEVERMLGGRAQLCYILKPVYDKSLTICVPSESETLMAKMHPVLTKDEVYDIIRDIPEESACFESDQNLRRQSYAATLKGGDRRALVRMIKSIYSCKQERQAVGKRLSSFDENAMRDAENILYREFALVLGIAPDEVLPFINRQIAPETVQ